MADVAIVVIGIAIALTFAVGAVQMLRWVANLFSAPSAVGQRQSSTVVTMRGQRTINWSPPRAVGYVLFAGLLGVSLGRMSVAETQANATSPPADGAMKVIDAAEAVGIAAIPYPDSLLNDTDPINALDGLNYDEPYFANCSEARASGAAPVREGEPGYAAHLDRDNDGVGCE